MLADMLENFRYVCLSIYNLDAAHYFTTPELSFDAMTKYTGQKLQLLSDYDMLLMFENGQYIIFKNMHIIIIYIYSLGIRSGLVQAIKRYGKATNNKTLDYDETKEKSWIIYQDCKFFFYNF